jgi:hypothetical protein
LSSINTFARHAAVLAAASGLVLTTGMAANAATAPVQRGSVAASHVDVKGLVSAPLTADSSVRISFDRPAVAAVAAPVTQQSKPATPVPAAAPAVAPAAKPVAPKATVHVQAAPAAAPAAKAPALAPAAGRNAIMLASAYRQVGITQDCTAMVEKALRAAGKPVGDIGPRAFLGLGTRVSTPIPGDMVVQSGHVGIYAGNGRVVSGGMNYKNQTMVHPLSWLTATGPVTFVRA